MTRLGYIFVIAALLFVPFEPAFSAADSHSGEDTVKVDPATEVVINGGLKYLASKQLPDGSWTGDNNMQMNRWPIAMTSYVMLAFLANGNLPDAGPYAKNVKKGLKFLLNSVQPDGTFLEGDRGHYMYSHGLATMVLAEIYGETQDPTIKNKLKTVVLLIVDAQNPEGGWRYQPGSADADISVTVPQVVALCAAKRAGIHVPQVVIDKAVAYIKRCQVGQSGGFAYMANHAMGPGFARTSAAMYALQISGLYDDPIIISASDFAMGMLKRNPQFVDYATYGNYYAAVGHYLLGGERWKNYYELYSGFLLKNVTTDDEGCHWGANIDPMARMVGPNWTTAVYTTILSLPYGYIPLYQR